MRVATGLALLWLAGCAAVPPRVAAPPAGADPATLSGWTASGRLALDVAGEGGSGAFIWRQQDGRSELSLRGPLGAGAFELATDGETFELSDAGGRRLDADEARRQVEARLGAALPWASLRYWMVGVPAPGVEARVLDASSDPVRVIEQSGWEVRYDRLVLKDGYALPQRLTAQSGPVRLKLLVDEWRLP